MLPEGFADPAAWFGRLLSQWAIAEVAPGRPMPWLAVSYGLGIVVYFTADRELAWWAAVTLALAAIVVAIMARRRVIGSTLAFGFAASATGFATGTLRTEIVAHPVLHYSASSVTLSGFVEIREERERSDRITVRGHHIESSRHLSEQPDRVRLAVRKNTAPAVGSFIELKAHLSPPLAPLRPGGYDFARDMYFQSIGASG
ncbi:MAG: ComEC/Rec2 family competence protein [Pseudolabrys sp.]